MGRRRVNRGWRLSRSKSKIFCLFVCTIEDPQHLHTMLEYIRRLLCPSRPRQFKDSQIVVHSPLTKRTYIQHSCKKLCAPMESFLLRTPRRQKRPNTSSSPTSPATSLSPPLLSYPLPSPDPFFPSTLPPESSLLFNNPLTPPLSSRIPTGHMRWDPSTTRMWCGPGLPMPTVDEMNNEAR